MLNKTTISEIKSIIFKYIDPKYTKVFIFGSRVIGDNLKWSDIDVGIEAKKSLPLSKISEVKEAFEESDIPYIVDIVDFKAVSQRFKKIVGKNKYYLN